MEVEEMVEWLEKDPRAAKARAANEKLLRSQEDRNIGEITLPPYLAYGKKGMGGKETNVDAAAERWPLPSLRTAAPRVGGKRTRVAGEGPGGWVAYVWGSF